MAAAREEQRTSARVDGAPARSTAAAGRARGARRAALALADGGRASRAPLRVDGVPVDAMLALSASSGACRRAESALYERRSPRPTRPSPRRARAAKANVHLGRLAAWCVAAANCRDALLRARHTTPQPPRGPPASAVVAAGERAVKRWLRLCAPGGASPEKSPEKPPQALTTPSRFAQTRRRRRPAPSCPPPSTPSLESYF